MGPEGHITINNYYLKGLFQRFDKLVIPKSLKVSYLDFETISLGLYPCGRKAVQRFSLLLLGLKIILKENPARVILLSYDVLTFPILSWVLKIAGIELFCFEHNTAPSRKARRLLHLVASKHSRHFVFTPYIGLLFRGIKNGVFYVPHLCINQLEKSVNGAEWKTLMSDQRGGFKSVGLCSSGSVTEEQIKEVASLYPDFLFVVKSNNKIAVSNIVTVKYFKEYSSALKSTDFVVVPFALSSKVSGPVYEAIAAGKPVVVARNIFGEYIKEKFPGRVFFVGERFPKKLEPFDHRKYNTQILETLNTLIPTLH